MKIPDDIVTKKRFWGMLILIVGAVLKYVTHIPIPDEVLYGGGTLLGAGVIDAAKK